ncbi:hypothetical protein [Nocardia donostiensis]|uniref:Uncharacterized protein n=1 Tax=Nocardia donostiensis TaxID=1538463 RepID=A0A1W0ASE4_9NOCA|nr:hypothetical protein [Nocardia donostiensis]ONM47944.1 hypothetical protein B0T46_15010 [Nocardia donostiensis]OQS13143.1 hypothetical protein B0T36_21610 [Nocardia donostiensis]OQS21487.1 hypothetical protein B0T44_07615 [Nocardia donostiensis]
MNTDDRTGATPGSSPGHGASGPHLQVTADDLRRLLAANVPHACLVLEQGSIRLTEVTDEPQGLLVITRDELTNRLGTAFDNTQLAEQVAELNNEIRLQGA